MHENQAQSGERAETVRFFKCQNELDVKRQLNWCARFAGYRTLSGMYRGILLSVEQQILWPLPF